MTRKMWIIPGAVASTVIAGLSYVMFGRRLVLNWGATTAEARAELPGDELLPSVAIQTTRVVTVNAPPDAIWPWLLQMGPKPRAGVYTYDWIERLLGIDVDSSAEILPEFQHMDVGEYFPLNKQRTNGITVRRIESQRALVFQWEPATSTWAFILEPLPDGTTRLISRNRIPGSGVKFWAGMVGLMEPGSLVMERKMLLGIKARAERLAAQRVANAEGAAPAQGIPQSA